MFQKHFIVVHDMKIDYEIKQSYCILYIETCERGGLYMIKCIATDMDGTFLSSVVDYDRIYFDNVYKRMKKAGIQFVVASGNQFYQIASFFEDPDILYAADNGAWIRTLDEEFFHASMDHDVMTFMCELCERYPSVEVCVSAKRFAYVKSEKVKETMKPYFPKLKIIDNFRDINDTIFKITITSGVEDCTNLQEELQAYAHDDVDIVQCGWNCIDINVKGCNKGFALKFICEQLNFSLAECMCFGDSENDVEMLKLAGFSYAMDNASEKAKAAAKYHCVSNRDHGVLKTIDTYLTSIGF